MYERSVWGKTLTFFVELPNPIGRKFSPRDVTVLEEVWSTGQRKLTVVKFGLSGANGPATVLDDDYPVEIGIGEGARRSLLKPMQTADHNQIDWQFRRL